jgi:hypothetical protein
MIGEVMMFPVAKGHLGHDPLALKARARNLKLIRGFFPESGINQWRATPFNKISFIFGQ